MIVYAIVVLYNGERYVDKCFGSLRLSSMPVRVIAVDNASTDRTLERVRSDYKEVEVVAMPKNLGFGAANNIAIKKAYDEGAEFFFLLNQDAWIEPDTIASLANAQMVQEGFDLVSPVHLTGSGNRLEHCFSGCFRSDAGPDLLSDLFFRRLEDRIYSIGYAPAAAWLMTRKCIATIGGFSPTFFHYGEDDNYLQRLKYHGLHIGMYPFSKIYHDVEFRRNSPLNSEFKMLLVKLSNPNFETDFKREKRARVRNVIRAALGLSRSRLSSALEEYRLYSAVAGSLERNFKRSQQKGLIFLESTGGQA